MAAKISSGGWRATRHDRSTSFHCLTSNSILDGWSALPANLCPFSGCHECEGFDGEVWSSELHSGGKLTQSEYHRKMNSTAARAAIGSIWCGGTESEIKES